MFNLYTWMTGISCVSQMFALYCLLLFYHALHEELYAVRPFAKFVCIKLVVFFSWFQSVSIGALVQLGRIDGIEDAEAGDGDAHSPQEVAEGIQNLLITMEMLLAALAFYTSFSVSEFVIDTLPTHMQGGQYSALPTLPTGKATTISSTNEHDSDITPSPSPYETDTELELLHDFEIAHSAQSKASKDSLTGGSAIALKRPTGVDFKNSILMTISNLGVICNSSSTSFNAIELLGRHSAAARRGRGLGQGEDRQNDIHIQRPA